MTADFNNSGVAAAVVWKKLSGISFPELRTKDRVCSFLRERKFSEIN